MSPRSPERDERFQTYIRSIAKEAIRNADMPHVVDIEESFEKYNLRLGVKLPFEGVLYEITKFDWWILDGNMVQFGIDAVQVDK